MSTETSFHFSHLLQVSKKSLCMLILYNFFHDFIHVYSPGAGADSPQGTKFWRQQKRLITLPICCKFQRNLFEVWIYTFFSWFNTWIYSSTRWSIPRFKVIGLLVPEKKIFLGFYHIWAWRPAWSCDQDHLSKRLFPHPIEATYENWLWLAQWCLRRRCLKNVYDDGRQRTTTEAYLSYKLTKWAFGSSELNFNVSIKCPL